mgnify:CR=1 FL=1|tara:strand:+ start:161 stop:508 length:348 start_codon:yes stop_codon:yes gene_type:complete
MDYFQKYQKYKSKYLNLLSSNNQVGGKAPKDLYLFKAEWCGHCKSFKNDWDTLQNDSELKGKINFITMDSDKNATNIKEWNIEGYPTIILKSGNKATEYNGPRNINAIKEFINKN